MTILSYCPEMGEPKPVNTNGNITLAHNGRHYFIETPVNLSGRGVEFVEVLKSSNLTERGQYKAGWNVYRVTLRALAALNGKHTFAREALLD